MNLLKKNMIAALFATAALLPAGLFAQDAKQLETCYAETTKTLDNGDNNLAFNYVNLTPGFDAAGRIADYIFNLPALKGNQDAELFKKIASDLLKQTGVLRIEGLGTSVTKAENRDFFTIKNVVYAPFMRQRGLFWNLYGQKAHKLQELRYLPQNTLIGFSVDVGSAEVYKFLTLNLEKLETLYKFPAPNQEFQKMLKAAEKEGFDIPKIAGTLENITIFVTGPENKKDMIPGMTPGVGGVTLICKMSDKKLYEVISKKLKELNPEIVRDGVLSLPVPLPPVQGKELPPLTLTMFQVDSSLVLTTQFDLAKAMLSGRTPNLTTTKSFVALSKGIPLEGNAFFYCSSEFGKTIEKIVEANMKGDDELVAVPIILKGLFEALSVSKATFAVSGRTPLGYSDICNTESETLALFADPYASQMLYSIGFMGVMYNEGVKNLQSYHQQMNAGSEEDWVDERGFIR